MKLKEIIEMLGFTYDPNKKTSRNESAGLVLYSDHGVCIIKKTHGIVVEALYDEAASADNLVKIGFDILKKTNAKGNNLVDCRYTTPDTLWFNIQWLVDVDTSE